MYFWMYRSASQTKAILTAWHFINGVRCNVAAGAKVNFCWLMWCGEGTAADEGLILLVPVLRKERVLCRMLKLDSDKPPRQEKKLAEKDWVLTKRNGWFPLKKTPRLWIKVTSYCNVTKVMSGGIGAAASLRRASSHYHFLLYQQFSTATTAQFIRKLQSKVAKLLFLSLREKDSACDFWDILPGAIKTF